jgi:hypothetical protein
VSNLLRTILPAKVPAKTRLVATLKELTRIVQALPEPVCTALEASGVIATWRAQLESVQALTGHVGNAGNVMGAAVDIANAIRRAVRTK